VRERERERESKRYLSVVDWLLIARGRSGSHLQQFTVSKKRRYAGEHIPPHLGDECLLPRHDKHLAVGDELLRIHLQLRRQVNARAVSGAVAMGKHVTTHNIQHAMREGKAKHPPAALAQQP
jgi:hypothetical protein